MTDDKPMSAEERAQQLVKYIAAESEKLGIQTPPGWVWIDQIATALRKHAAEAVEAEREACAGRFHKEQVEVWADEIIEHLIVFNNPQDYEEVLQLHKGVEDELYKIRDIVSAREGGESDA